MSSDKIFIRIRYAFVVLMILFSFAGVYAYLSSDYYSFLREFLIKTQRTKEFEPLIRTDPYFRPFKNPITGQQFAALYNNQTLSIIYTVVKYELVILLCILLFWLYDLMTVSRTRLSRFVNRKLNGMAACIIENVQYIKGLDSFVKRAMLILGILQGLYLIFFILHIPFEYDEQMDYFCFSSRGILQTATFYPFPNNHILFSEVTSFFIHLPLPPEVTMRIPNFIFYFIAEYYFFKLSRLCFSDTISLLVTTIYSIAYPVVFYAVMARGYTFMYGFTILLFYSSARWIAQPTSRKYRIVYILSMIGAVYTVPSCVYILGGMGLSVGTYLLFAQRWQQFFKFVLDNVLITVMLVLLYLPIVIYNGLGAISDPTGTPRFGSDMITQVAGPFFHRTWDYFVRGTEVPLLVAIPLIIAAFLAFLKRTLYRSMGWVSVIMLLSPLLILLLHRIAPVERVLGYLIVPVCLSVGFFLALLSPFVRRIDREGYIIKYQRPIALCFMIVLPVVLFANYRSYHWESRPVVYFAEDLYKKLGHDMEHIRSIGYTSDYYSQYLCECVLMKCYMIDPDRKIDLHSRVTGDHNDLEVLPAAMKDSVKSNEYQFLGSFYFSPKEHVDAYLRKW